MTQEIKTKIEIFLRELKSEIDIPYMVDIDNIDTSNAYQSIYDMIEDKNGFDIEIIYYSRAIEYLKNNDDSLRESLEIANDLGYELKNLNSEILASLLASQNSRSEFADLESDINSFFEDIQTEIDESEEEETNQ